VSAPREGGFARRHLLGIEGLRRAEIEHLLDTALTMREVLRRSVKKVPTLRGKAVVNLFFENSTRTRLSFEVAAKVLSADAYNISSSGSSAAKGETLVDTARNVDAMHPDVIVVRHASSGAAALLARHTRAAVANAGDGQHEHPTQALLDALTLREKLGTLEGKTITLVGDILHSRVARSNAYALAALGAKVVLCGPPTLLPRQLAQLPSVTLETDLRTALRHADAVMMLRIQLERMQGAFIPSTREYSRLYGIGLAQLGWMKPEAPILHPGPVNRGIELSPEVADGGRSVILDQVENGVAVRMAVLYLLAGGAAQPPERA
jgi:aspartate carbamoyltransferase catalytic subunit